MLQALLEFKPNKKPIKKEAAPSEKPPFPFEYIYYQKLILSAILDTWIQLPSSIKTAYKQKLGTWFVLKWYPNNRIDDYSYFKKLNSHKAILFIEKTFLNIQSGIPTYRDIHTLQIFTKKIKELRLLYNLPPLPYLEEIPR